MNSLFRRPSPSDWVVIGVFWAAAIPFIFSDYAEVVQKVGLARFLGLTALSIVGPLLLTLILVFSLMPRLLFRQRYVLFILGLVAVSFTLTYLYRLGWGLIWNVTPTMNVDQLLNTLISIVQKAGVLSAMRV